MLYFGGEPVVGCKKCNLTGRESRPLAVPLLPARSLWDKMTWCVLTVENPCFDISSGRAGTRCAACLFWMNSLGAVVQKILHTTVCCCTLDSNILDGSSYKTGQGIFNPCVLFVIWFSIISKSCFNCCKDQITNGECPQWPCSYLWHHKIYASTV